jgi:RHS repeat-associated protein
LAGDNYLSIAEVEVIAATASGEGVKWLITDHLGSTRMVIDQTGSLVGTIRHDFAPFGEELSAGAGIRSASNGYSDDSVRQKFTSHERDDETGLDFMQARYYSSLQGRFTSVDPINVTVGRMLDPQQFNLYSYVRNNPLAYTDPTGMNPQETEEDKRKKREQEEAKKKNGKKTPTPNPAIVNKAVNEVTFGSDTYIPSHEMAGDLRDIYVGEYEDQFQTLEEQDTAGKFGNTIPQSTTVTDSKSETRSTTEGVELGISGKSVGGSVNTSGTRSGTRGGEVSVNSSIRQSSRAARNVALTNMRGQFIEDYVGTPIRLRNNTNPRDRGRMITLDDRTTAAILSQVTRQAREHAKNTFGFARRR